VRQCDRDGHIFALISSRIATVRFPLINEHLEHPVGDVVFQHACKLGAEGIVSKRLGSRYRSGRSPDWLKFKNPNAPAVKREGEEDWAGDKD
jgi:ATP-dependent DNA ligase